MKIFSFLFFILFGIQNLLAQQIFTRKDSLQGSLRLERTCYDVLHYDLNLIINPKEKSIRGFNEITFKVIENSKKNSIGLV